MINSRRNFIKKAAVTGAAIMAAPSVFGIRQQKAADAVTPFKLKVCSRTYYVPPECRTGSG